MKIKDHPTRKKRARNADLARPILFPFAVSDDEYEYLARVARHRGFVSLKGRPKVAKFLRKKLFPPDWRSHLPELRERQGANVK